MKWPLRHPWHRIPLVRYTPNFTNVAESPMGRIATAAEAMPGSIKLCYGESDMPTPAFICEAAHEAAGSRIRS